MQRFPRYCLLCTAVLSMTLLAVSIGQRLGPRATSLRTLADWGFPELADHLNRAGLEVRLRSTRSDGEFDHNIYLTTTDKAWYDLNLLGINVGPSRLPEWQGTVYCERAQGQEPADLIGQWGDPSLAIGPFVFYGDAELLERIRTALAPAAPHAQP